MSQPPSYEQKGGPGYPPQSSYGQQPPPGQYGQQPPPGSYGQQPPPGQYSGASQPGPYPTSQPGSYQNTYPPPQGTHTTTVYTQPAVVITAPAFHSMGEFPLTTTCPHCKAMVTTRTQYETGTLTWLICGILLLVGCWLGCCLIPFCVDGCKDVIHSCPNCNQVVGRYKRI